MIFELGLSHTRFPVISRTPFDMDLLQKIYTEGARIAQAPPAGGGGERLLTQGSENSISFPEVYNEDIAKNVKHTTQNLHQYSFALLLQTNNIVFQLPCSRSASRRSATGRGRIISNSE